jgi:thioredoxin 1
MHRRAFVSGLVAAGLLPHTAQAYPAVPYAPATWPALRDGADRLVLDFRANWSLTCRIKREMIVELLAENPDFERLTFVDVDWDTFGPSEWVQKRLKVDRRSTLIAFRGETELARLVNAPDRIEIRMFLETALTA